jgi:hypothetical protein
MILPSPELASLPTGEAYRTARLALPMFNSSSDLEAYFTMRVELFAINAVECAGSWQAPFPVTATTLLGE